jgi:hypothetical protein
VNTLNDLFRTVKRSPILWGILGSVAFFGLVHGGPLGTPFIKRYFTGHPVEYAETVLFAIGLAALVLKTLEVLGQYGEQRQSPLGPASRTAQPIEEQCGPLLERLNQLPRGRQEGYYVRRLRAAIEHVKRIGSAEGLDDQLKYMADVDATRLHNGYALFRVIIWAIPILGFLGTVVGITMALNGLDPKALDESMMNVTTGLGVKFDTTALALAMSMLLMFIHFFVDRAENALLEKVDGRVETDLAGRFQQVSSGPDGQVAAMRRMAEVMIQASELLVARQAELWQASMDAAAQRWAQTAETAGGLLKKALAEALAESLRTHAQNLAAAEQAATDKNRQQWDKLQQGAAQQVHALAAMQTGFTRQAEILGRAIEASGEVTQLQDALNRNLAALSGATHFEQTVLGLAAAIHLLNARLTGEPANGPVRLDTTERRLEPPPAVRRTPQAA